MKKLLSIITILLVLNAAAFAQKKNESKNKVTVPPAVIMALSKKYPQASKVTWEKEKGNYEANWGGKSGEDNSVQYTPAGDFIEIVKAIPPGELPGPVRVYVKQHYNGAKISEAGRVTNADGKTSYEAEIKGKDVIFDEKGGFVKAEK